MYQWFISGLGFLRPYARIVSNRQLALFDSLIIYTFQLVFSAGTMFFSHNKSAGTMFRLIFSVKWTGQEIASANRRPEGVVPISRFDSVGPRTRAVDTLTVELLAVQTCSTDQHHCSNRLARSGQILWWASMFSIQRNFCSIGSSEFRAYIPRSPILWDLSRWKMAVQ